MNCKLTFEIYFLVCLDENLESNLKDENNKYVINLKMFTVGERVEYFENLYLSIFANSIALKKIRLKNGMKS